MAQAAIHPGSRKNIAAVAAFVVVAAAGASVAPGLLSQVMCPPAPTGGQAMILELDFLAGTSAIVSRTSPDCPMPNAVAPLGLNLSVETTLESYTPTDPNDCLLRAEADSLLCGTLASDSDWKVHGLVVPNPAVKEIGASGGLVCPGGRLGVIWLMPPCGSSTSSSSNTWVSGFRKHFLAFWQKDEPDPDVRNNEAFVTNVHELGHVLNLHHCEYDHDGLNDYGLFNTNGYCTHHVDEKSGNPKHVKPGTIAEPGLPFCDYNRKHWKRHKGSSCCSTERVEEPETSAPTEEVLALRGKLKLTASPEKTRYFPGEPIHLDISLKPREGVADVSGYSYMPESLNPEFGHLFISVSPNASPDNFRTLGTAFLQESKPSASIAFDPNGIERSGVGIWFTLSDSNNQPPRRDFNVKSEFAGFSDAALNLASDPVRIVVNMTNTTPGVYDADAYRLFMHPAARQFLFLLGGDHLKAGLENLSAISKSFPRSIYSPYADIALGVSLSRPFKGLDAQGRTINRAADLPKAKEHLLKAKAWNDGHVGDKTTELPRSWSAILDATLAYVQTAGGPRQP